MLLIDSGDATLLICVSFLSKGFELSSIFFPFGVTCSSINLLLPNILESISFFSFQALSILDWLTSDFGGGVFDGGLLTVGFYLRLE